MYVYAVPNMVFMLTRLTVCLGSNLDKDASVKWIGETYLEAFAPVERSAISRSEFLRAWKDMLPEAWRDAASLDVLPVSSERKSDICFDTNAIYRQILINLPIPSRSVS
jgi:sister chromatid cohesion protein DCC1